MTKPRLSRHVHLAALCLCGALTALLAGCQTKGPLDPRHLPMAWPGFRWEIWREAGVAVLRPEQWVRQDDAPLPNLKASLVRATLPGQAPARLSIEARAQLTATTGHGPLAEAVALADALATQRNVAVQNTGPYAVDEQRVGVFVRYRQTDTPDRPEMVYRFYVASTKRDMLFIFTFRCPEDAWDDLFTQYGRVMLERLILQL